MVDQLDLAYSRSITSFASKLMMTVTVSTIISITMFKKRAVPIAMSTGMAIGYEWSESQNRITAARNELNLVSSEKLKLGAVAKCNK